MKIIDADALKACAEKAWLSTRLIDEAIALDPVHTAGACYCGECKYFSRRATLPRDFGECEIAGIQKRINGFCNCGKLKKG